MNQNLNKVELPEGATYNGQEILKVLSRVISDNEAEDGYVILTGDGEKTFITDDEFADLSIESKDDGEDKK